MESDASAIVPGRACGGCSLCCKVMVIAELAKPAGTWCHGWHLLSRSAGRKTFASDPDLIETWPVGARTSKAAQMLI